MRSALGLTLRWREGEGVEESSESEWVLDLTWVMMKLQEQGWLPDSWPR